MDETQVRAARRSRRSAIAAMRRTLVERFPRAFMAKGVKKLPLKLGIYHDIRLVAPELASVVLRNTLFDYTAGRTYLEALTTGAPRVDLDGWPSGIVTEAHARGARTRLRKLDTPNCRKEQNHAARPAA